VRLFNSFVGSVVASATLLAACGGQATAPTSVAGSAPGGAQPSAAVSAAAAAAKPSAAPSGAASGAALASGSTAATWDALLAAGRKEGSVVIGGPPFPSLREAYTSQFKKDTGIDLQYLALPTAEVSSRAEREAEAGKSTMDVIQSGGAELYTLLPKNLLEPLTSKVVLPEVTDPKQWKGDQGIKWMDFQKQYVPLGSSWVMTDLFINTQLVQPGSITSWNDLLDPKWKGKIVATDPRGGGPGQALARYLLVKFGDKFLVDLYKGQQAVMNADQRAVAEGVARGSYAIALAPVQADVELLRKSNLPIAREFPKDGQGSLVGGFSAIKIPKAEPHPNAAAVFINWYLSKNGQTAYSQAMLEPSLRKDVSADGIPPYVVPKPDVQYDVDEYSPDFYINNAPKMQQQIRTLLGQ
jgi:ABC-type Fe3+ transport system substrate-binding protein